MRASLVCFLACLLCGSGFGAPLPTASISDLGWMAGRWVDDSDGNLSEEIWTPPSGDCIVGMWRWVVGGNVKLYEFLTITAEADGVVLRLRHFDRLGVGWEDKDHPLILKLLRSKEGEAVFEGPGTKGFLRLSYRRVDAETLAGLLEKGTSEKDAEREEFRFRRKPL